MKPYLLAAALAATALPALAEHERVYYREVGHSDYYGPVSVGEAQQPRLIYVDPVVIQPVPVAHGVEPLYMRVPSGYESSWARHCRDYNACGRPVYFVQDGWYQDTYVSRLEHHGDGTKDAQGRRLGKQGMNKARRADPQ